MKDQLLIQDFEELRTRQPPAGTETLVPLANFSPEIRSSAAFEISAVLPESV
jgi:hypothetical protein